MERKNQHNISLHCKVEHFYSEEYITSKCKFVYVTKHVCIVLFKKIYFLTLIKLIIDLDKKGIKRKRGEEFHPSGFSLELSEKQRNKVKLKAASRRRLI